MTQAVLITEHDVRMIVAQPGAMTEGIAAVERAIVAQAKGEAELHTRVHLDHPRESSPWARIGTAGRALGMLPAVVPALGAAAVRIYTNRGPADPPCELILLFDLETMELRSVVEDYTLHSLRTGAPSAVATNYLADPDADSIGIIGT